MNKLLTSVAIVVTLFAGAMIACADDNNSIALGLGNILGSQEACRLTIDQNAIQQFIKEHVDPSDMRFPDNLRGATQADKNEVQAMSPTELANHCLATGRIAKHYGFTQ